MNMAFIGAKRGGLHRLLQRARSGCAVAGMVAVMGVNAACIEIQSSPLDTSQGGLLGFLGLVIRGTAGSTLVAVGANGLAYTSSDAQNWQQTTVVSDATITLHDVIWTGTRFVAVGGSASACVIFYSNDGFNWTNATTPACTVSLFAVAASADGQRVVAVGDVSGPSPIAFTSGDGGDTWATLATAGTRRYGRVVFANNLFFAMSDPLNAIDVAGFTSDGTAAFGAIVNAPLPTASKGSTLGDVIAIGNRVIMASNDPNTMPPQVMRSSTTLDNGTSAWTVNATNIFGSSSANFPRALALSTAGRLVAVGDACFVDGTSDLANLAWSGVQTTITGCSGVDWMAMIYDGSRFLAVGNDGGGSGFAALSTTGDAASWVQSPIGSTLIYSLAINN